jgi:hypothetical protein
MSLVVNSNLAFNPTHASLLSTNTVVFNNQQTRHPFVLLSLLLHVALLLFIPSLTKNYAVTQPRPMQVYFSAPPIYTPSITEQHHIQNKVPAKKLHLLAKFPNTTTTQVTPLVAQPDITPAIAAHTPPAFDSNLLIESAKNMARNDARKSEQDIAEVDKKKANTQAGLLAQYLKLPHQEIRLTDGTLEIITAIGKVCFQPPPVFARDLPNLYGIPSTCP